MITYTAKHHSGAVKVRKSKGHTEPKYTHAIWARWNDKLRKAGYYPSRADGEWHCVSICAAGTASKTHDQWAKAGYDTDITPVEAK